MADKKKATGGKPRAAEPKRKKAKHAPGVQEGAGEAAEGAAILGRVEDAVRRYVVLPHEHAYVTVTLWIAATYGIDQWDYAPRLPIVSPEKRCGKTRLLDVIEYLCHRPIATVNASVAAITRSIPKKSPPTLLVDEADTIFGTKRSNDNNEDLRGIINAGHQRGRPVLRWDVTSRSLDELQSFAMVALASIKDMPDTIMDRGPVVRMRRRAQDESVQPFRRRRDGEGVLASIKEELSAWMAEQTFPDEVADLPVEDRAADNWEPLIAVADAAGGEWPERARLAAKFMTEGEATVAQESFGLELLSDIRDLWLHSGKWPSAHTADLLAALHDIDESPWRNYNGRALDGNGLARLLKPYGVRSGQVKVAGKNAKGYRLDGFAVPGESGTLSGGLSDAWARYLPPAEEAEA
jgi:hypothetical protein